MCVMCNATVEDERQRANLCECVKILGGNPAVTDLNVFVEYEGSNATAEKFIELFSQYSEHAICTLS